MLATLTEYGLRLTAGSDVTDCKQSNRLYIYIYIYIYRINLRNETLTPLFCHCVGQFWPMCGMCNVEQSVPILFPVLLLIIRPKSQSRTPFNVRLILHFYHVF